MTSKSYTKVAGEVDGLVSATPTLDVINAFEALRHDLGITGVVPPQAACDHIRKMYKTSLEQKVTLSQIRSALGMAAVEAAQDSFESVPDHQLPGIVSDCYTSYKFHRELLKDAPHLHSETLSLFLVTAAEMLKALANGEHGRPPLAWMAENWEGRCKQSIREHIRAGNYVDAMNYLMFANHHDWSMTGFGPGSKSKSGLREDICDYLSMDRGTTTAGQILDKIKELSEYASMAQPDGPVVSYEFASPRDLKNYQSLCDVLFGALHQAAYGKGRERHANDDPFESQRMQVISDQVGSVSGMAYQVVKKVTEALNMPTVEQQERELYGAINYTAGMLIWLKRHDEDNEV
ncbi:hypothetical protein F418_p45 [Hafnia phage Enc34]|uniref:Uncharacterized protein n=1 Tax=Hafnia phage Enc34 TaxID=1150990 RepID=H6WYK7_9CAUD|nr:hypothetical protein F418_p45 [Hafnia phage Enc34]AFB84062.1 hypothetical protein [Hafnia phage Enc34]